MPPIERLIEDVKTWCSQQRGRQMELAHLLGVHRSAITNWFAGRQRPTAEQAERMRELLTKHKRAESSKLRSAGHPGTPITFRADQDVVENLKKFVELVRLTPQQVINDLLRSVFVSTFRKGGGIIDDPYIQWVIEGTVYTLEDAQAIAANHRRYMRAYTLHPRATPVRNPKGDGWLIKFVEPSEEAVQEHKKRLKKGK